MEIWRLSNDLVPKLRLRRRRDVPPGLVSLFASGRQRNSRVHTERQHLFFTGEGIAITPVFRPAGFHQQDKPVAVWQLIVFLGRLCRFDLSRV